MGREDEQVSGWKRRPLDLVRFRKVWAMTASPVEGEAKAARRLADRMAEAAGMFLSDAVKAAALPDEKSDEVYVPPAYRTR